MLQPPVSPTSNDFGTFNDKYLLNPSPTPNTRQRVLDSAFSRKDYSGLTAFACSMTLNAGFINGLGFCVAGSGGLDSGASKWCSHVSWSRGSEADVGRVHSEIHELTPRLRLLASAYVNLIRVEYLRDIVISS